MIFFFSSRRRHTRLQGDEFRRVLFRSAGFDWLLIDGEHSPNDTRTLLAQLQAIAAYPDSHAIARVPMGHGEVGEMLIKQYLDIGVQTLLVPMVDTAEQARSEERRVGKECRSRWSPYH